MPELLPYFRFPLRRIAEFDLMSRKPRPELEQKCRNARLPKAAVGWGSRDGGGGRAICALTTASVVAASFICTGAAGACIGTIGTAGTVRTPARTPRAAGIGSQRIARAAAQLARFARQHAQRAQLALAADAQNRSTDRSEKDAALILDGETGRPLYARNADALRHPASLTKMMTLYLLFEQLKSGQMSLATPISVSAHAASQPRTKLYVHPGATIPVETAIKAVWCSLPMTLPSLSRKLLAERKAILPS